MKIYLEPKIEVLPVGTVFALCDGSNTGSGDPNSFNTNPVGGSQGDLGRAPRRTKVF